MPILQMTQCEVGVFKLPGIVFDSDEITPELHQEMVEWSNSDHGVGKNHTELLWSFKTPAQRDWFILKWSS